MKNKRIRIAIVMILAVGISFTRYTQNYVYEHETQALEDFETTGPNQNVMRSMPFAAASPAGPETEAETQTGPEYLTRLRELDQELARNHEAEQRAGSASGYQARIRLEGELSLWQAEVDQILDILEDQLSAAELDQLLQEQQEWIRGRESRAVAASGRQQKNASEELEYTRSQLADTRTRAYELVEQYAATFYLINESYYDKIQG